jgi:phage portal protein BeeE
MWVAAIKLALAVAAFLTERARQRGALLDAEAKLLAGQMNVSLDTLEAVRNARNAAESDFDQSGGLPKDDDPNLRD